MGNIDFRGVLATKRMKTRASAHEIERFEVINGQDSLHETKIDSRHWKRELQCAVLAVRGGETQVNGFHGYEPAGFELI